MNIAEAVLSELATEINHFHKQGTAAAVECGKRLLLVKEHVGHGNFRQWVFDNVDCSITTANRRMRLARLYKVRLNKSPVIDLAQPVTQTYKETGILKESKPVESEGTEPETDSTPAVKAKNSIERLMKVLRTTTKEERTEILSELTGLVSWYETLHGEREVAEAIPFDITLPTIVEKQNVQEEFREIQKGARKQFNIAFECYPEEPTNSVQFSNSRNDLFNWIFRKNPESKVNFETLVAMKTVHAMRFLTEYLCEKISEEQKNSERRRKDLSKHIVREHRLMELMKDLPLYQTAQALVEESELAE